MHLTPHSQILQGELASKDPAGALLWARSFSRSDIQDPRLFSGDVQMGNVLVVDAVNGDPNTATRGTFSKPFQTIQAAIIAAVAFDLVLVLPGTYNELVTCKDDVSITSLDPRRTKLIRASLVNETMLTMAERITVNGLTIEGSNAGGALLTMGVKFTGTSNATSTLRRCVMLGTSGNFQPVEMAGTGLIPVGRTTLVDVQAIGSGITNGFLHSGSGVSRMRGCQVFGLVGVTVTAGTLEIQWSRTEGFPVAISISAGATVGIDAASTYNALSNAGTFQKIQNSVRSQLQTVQDTSTIAISNVTPTIVSTIPSLSTGGNDAIVDATITFNNTAALQATPSVRLFRDGVEVSATDRYDFRVQVLDDQVSGHFHWVDANATGAHVYTIRVLADILLTNVVTNRRATARV